MEERDLDVALGVCRNAFGTFLNVPDVSTFWQDKDFVRTRWRGKTGAAIVAESNGVFAGSNVITKWGSFGFFGPLTTRPELWGQGVAKALLGATMDVFDAWATRDAGLFTFPHSVKHVGLYQKFGFHPRFLTAVLSKAPVAHGAWTGYSQLDAAGRSDALKECGALADAVHDGLDLSAEIESVFAQKLGETILLRDSDRLDGFAVCHFGAGTEAGVGLCYVKFAIARNAQAFDRLLTAFESWAATIGASRIEVGVNAARVQAYRAMFAHGYRSQMQGVAMQKPNTPGFNREDAWVLDDWR